ncbi:MAG: glycosyltransferase family 2 protein [Spirochaetes bacterium]|nr:glycosyltransferase family 2 protein [Spirochaetota bacterium]
MTKNVSVLVPCYNEESSIVLVLKKLLRLNFVQDIVVVNDCSTDNSETMILSLKSPKIKYIKHDKNRGKTAAISTAKTHAEGEIIIIQDADLEYDPNEMIHVIEPIWNGVADVVYGSRFMIRKASRVLYFYHYIANKFLTFLSNFFTNLNMSDIETCYKAFKAPILKEMRLTSKGFGMEVEITAMISRLPIRVFEVPISYYGRTYEEGKKIGLKDGIDLPPEFC